MNFKRYMLQAAFLGLVASVAACSSSTTSTTTDDTDDDADAPQLLTIDELPKATAPVEAASASLSAKSKQLAYLATTGMSLGVAPDFDTTTSLAACEIYNQTRQAIGNAAQGDLILCYIQSIFAAATDSPDVVVDTNGDPVTVDIYDGEEHIFDLDFSGLDEGEGEEGDDGGPDRIKFSITKTDAGVISAFTMHACRDEAQEMYLNQTIDGAAFSMTDKGTYDDSSDSGSFSGSYATAVTGTLNSSNRFTGEKEIVMQFTGVSDSDSSSNDNWGNMTFTQSSDSAEMQGYMSGTFTAGDESTTWVNSIVGSMQLLDSNADGDDYSISLLALGEGAVTGQMIGETEGGDIWDETFTEAWDGDTAVATEESDFLDLLADLTLLTSDTASEPDITFAGDEAYDCAGTAEAIIVFANADGDLMTTCDETLSFDNEWMDCWSTTQGEDGGGQDEGGQDEGGGCGSDDDCAPFNNESGTSTCEDGQCQVSCADDTDCDAVSEQAGSSFTCTILQNQQVGNCQPE